MQDLQRKFITGAKALGVVLALGAGALIASAATGFTWTPPTATAPNDNVAPPINVSDVSQTKGTVWSQGRWVKFLSGGSVNPALYVVNNDPNASYALSSVTTNPGARGLLTSGFQSNGNGDVFGNFTVGQNNAANNSFLTRINTLFQIDRSFATGPQGRNAIDIHGSADNDSVGIIQNKPWFFFWDYGSQPNDLASIRAKHGNFSGDVTATNVIANANVTAGGNADISGTIRVGGGNPGQDKILTSADGSGNAEWRNINDLIKMSQLLDVKYETHSWGDSDPDHWGDVSCPAGYVAISANCDCQDHLDACLIAQLNGNNDAVSIPDNQETTINWGLATPTPNWVTGNCHDGTSADNALHVQAVCLHLNDQGYNPQYVWKNIQAKDRKFCDNWGSYWDGVGKGCTVTWDTPASSPVVYIGAAHQSAKDWYLDKSNDGNQYAYGLMNAVPTSVLGGNQWGPTATAFLQPNSSLDHPYAAQYIPGTVSQSQLGNFNTGVRHSNLRDESYPAWTGEVAGCLYTDQQPGQNRPAANRLNYNVDALSDISNKLWSGPCDVNPDSTGPQHTSSYPGGDFPPTLYPVLSNDIWFLRPL